MRKGSMTVFFALILTVVLTFSLTLAESARVSGLKLSAQQAGEIAIDSMMAGYDRTLLEDYGLLFYDSSMGAGLSQCEEMEEEFEKYYMENAGRQRAATGGNLFKIDACDAEVTEMVAATDYDGEIFIRSALEFYKYEGTAEMLEKMISGSRAFQQADSVDHSSGEVPSGSAVQNGLSALGMSCISGKEASVLNIKFVESADVMNAKVVEAADVMNSKVVEENYVMKEMTVWNAENAAPDPDEDFDSEKYDLAIRNSPIGGVKKVKAGGWMKLVLPSGSVISGNSFETDELPSKIARDSRELEGGSLVEDAAEKVAFDEYLMSTFDNYLDSRSNSEDEADRQLYEQEYILFGKDSDDANLKAVLNRLIWIREGLNLIYAATSTELQNEAAEMAETLVGWTCIEVLVPIVQVALIGAWSYAESLADLKILLEGGKVPLFKNSGNQSLSIENMASFLAGSDTELSSSDDGLSYEDHLRVLMFMSDAHDLAYRAMDAIQIQMREKNDDFLMSSQIYALEVRAEVRAPRLFSGLPLVLGTARSADLGGTLEEYKWRSSFSQTY